MTRMVRLLGAAVAVVVAIHVLDWILAPALPLLVVLFVMALVAYVVMGWRDL
jgi:hypothetical protein